MRETIGFLKRWKDWDEVWEVVSISPCALVTRCFVLMILVLILFDWRPFPSPFLWACFFFFDFL